MPSETRTLKTAPVDPRFPNQNQAQRCWTLYNEYCLCAKYEDEEACKQQRIDAVTICPNLWVEQWDEQREVDTFAGIK